MASEEQVLADYPPMPPLSQNELDTAASYEGELRKAITLRIAGGVGMAAVAAAIAVGVAERPAPIDAGPGISASANFMTADYSGADIGPSTVGLPRLHATFHGVDLGINLNIKRLDTTSDSPQQQALAGILEDPRATLGPEIETAFYWRAGEGLLAGLAALGTMETSRRLLRRRHRANVAAEEDRLERLEAHDNLPDNVKQQIPADTRQRDQAELAELKLRQEKRAAHKPWQKASAALAGLGILLGGASLHHEIDNLKPPAANHTVILPSNSPNPYIQEIIADEPMLADTFVTGDLGYLLQQGIVQITGEMQQVNEYWSGLGNTLVNEVLPEFRAQGGMDWQNDPNITAFLQVTDIHDNRPYLKYFLPALIRAFNPDFVVDTGDEENFSGQDFLDNGAWQRLADALPRENRRGQPFQVVLVAGNHDDEKSTIAHKLTAQTSSGKTYHVFIPLDASDDYTTTLDGLTFVGSPDLNRTTHGTVPASTEGQLANDAKQGGELAQKACDVFQKTDERPIGLAHEPEAAYAAAASGCTSLDLSGHRHITYPVKAILNPDGTSITYQQDLGTASGDGPNNVTAIYNKATTDADVSLWLFNKVTGERQEILISASPSSTVPTVEKVLLPKPDAALPAMDDTDIRDFLDTYDPDFQPQPALADSGTGTENH